MNALSTRAGPVLALLILARGAAGDEVSRPKPDALELLRTGRYEQAEQQLRTLIARGQTAALLGLARVQLETGRATDAVASARRANKGPLRARALTLEGEAHLARGDRPAAQRVLQQATEAFPKHHRARVYLGLALWQQGEVALANAVFEGFYDAYDAGHIDKKSSRQLTYVALACRYSGNYQDAADLLRQATELDPKNVEAWVQWGQISSEKYDAKGAEKQFRKALAVNANYPPALIGLARIALKESFDVTGATRLLDLARGVAPANSDASVLRARALIDETRYLEAIALLQLTLKQHPTHLEGLSTLAAAYFMADRKKEFQRLKAKVLRLNRRYTTFFRTVAELAARQHRYKAAARLARAALQLDPRDAYAHAELGLNLLRLGREDEGIAELKLAWQGDPYNERTYRLLDLYEKVIPQQYEFSNSHHFRLRSHKSETKLLRRTVLPLLERAYRHYVRRYRFRPSGPIVVELYREHEHYAVRTVGMPRLAVLGVCFGRVITSVSPTRGQFNWAQVLWHELDHVFTIQLSKYRVPRWLTEGLADLEPALLRAEWRRESDFELYRALRSDRLNKLETLSRAFTRARNLDEMALGYYQSHLLAEFFEKRWGIARVVEALRAYGEGRMTAQIWPRITGLSLEQIDDAFRKAQRERLRPYAKGWMILPHRYRDLATLRRQAAGPDVDADALSALALSYLLHGKNREAALAAGRALKLQRHQKLALFTLARLAERKGDPPRATRRYNSLIAAGADGFGPRLALGRLALARGALDAARKHLQRAKQFNPEAAEPHALLARAYQRRKQLDQAILELKKLVRLSQQRAAPAMRLASMLAQRRDHAALREYGLFAYHIQPANSWLHERLAAAYEAPAPRPDLDKAIWHLETALLCKPRDAATIHRRLAKLLVRVGKKRQAAKHERLAGR